MIHRVTVVRVSMGKALRLVQTIEIQKDFKSLRQELKAQGHFDYPQSRLFWDFSRFAGLFAVSLGLCALNQTFLALIVLTLTTIDVTWWIHDAGHDAIFKSKTKAFWAIEAMGIFFLGMPQNGYHHYIHRRHHGSTNVLGRDLALETLPIAWDESQISQRWRKFVPYQAQIWFFLVLPLAYPLLNFGSISASVQKKQYAILASLVARWIVFLILFAGHLSMIWLPATIAGFVLGFMASLNHFHLPISKFPAPSFVGSVFERTQNVKEKGKIWTWLSGGLNFHIEHHLFPDMPSRNYPKISRDVRIFARYHGLPYQEARAADIVQALTRKLKNPKSPVKIQA
jgi:fatty acid desaturase